jgi:AraC-like DNA-binding protein
MQNGTVAKGASTGPRLLYREPRDFRVAVAEFRQPKAYDWTADFRPDRILLCINLSGRGEIACGSSAARYGDNTWGFFYTGRGEWTATRAAGEAHSFVTLSWSRAAFQAQFPNGQEELAPLLRACLQPKAAPAAMPTAPLSLRLAALAGELREPPVSEAAAGLWYQGKALELLSLLAFEQAKPQEMFCSRQKRVSRERVDRTVQILQDNLSEPPDLETLGSQVGCSPFYLSRLFSKEMKATIPQYVRELRMQKAAELLRSGRYNVTEAALEVGYNSLSHFSKAFWEKFGCCPGLYPQGAKLFPQAKLR